MDQKPAGLSDKEWELILKLRKEAEYNKAFNDAVLACRRRLLTMAEECGGGSGVGGETYRVAGDALLKLQK